MRALASAFASPFSQSIAANLGETIDIDFTQSASPLRAIPYATGEAYKFIRASTVWCPAYDTDTQALKQVEIPANVPPMPGMRWDAVDNLWSPYDDNGALIPASFRKGYWYLPQATNSVAYSRDFTNAYWTQSNCTVIKNAIGFDGVANNGCTLTDASTTLTALIQKNFTVSADGAVNAAIYIVAKDQDESRFPGFFLNYSGGSNRLFSVHINTKTGASAAGSNSDPAANSWEVLDGGDSLIVILYSKNISSYGNTVAAIRVDPAGAKILGTGDASATGSIVLQNVDFRLNTSFYDGSPIVTNGNALTRLAGDYRLALANHSNTAGMVLCEMEPRLSSEQIGFAGNGIIDLDSSVGMLYFTNSVFRNGDNTANVLSVNTTFTPGIINKVAMRWSGSSRALLADSTEAAGPYDGDFRTRLGEIAIGYTSYAPFYLRSLRYYKIDRGTAWMQGQQT